MVVDKFFFRFTGPSRWDVTVFQFPQPEIEPRKDEGDARTAITADESRLVILDAQAFDAAPVAEVVMPRRIPYGAHGNWMAG